MAEHIESALPKPTPQQQQLEAAITSARSHLASLKGKHAHNALAIGLQEKIIKQYESRIAELKSEDTTWLT